MTDKELQAKARELASQAWAAAGIGTAEKKAEAAILDVLQEVAGTAEQRLEAALMNEAFTLDRALAAEAKLGEAVGLLRDWRRTAGCDPVNGMVDADTRDFLDVRPQAPAPAEPPCRDRRGPFACTMPGGHGGDWHDDGLRCWPTDEGASAMPERLAATPPTEAPAPGGEPFCDGCTDSENVRDHRCTGGACQCLACGMAAPSPETKETTR